MTIKKFFELVGGNDITATVFQNGTCILVVERPALVVSELGETTIKNARFNHFDLDSGFVDFEIEI